MTGWERFATRGNVAALLAAVLTGLLAGQVAGAGAVAALGGALGALAVAAGLRLALETSGQRDALLGVALAGFGAHTAMLALARPEAQAVALALGIAFGLALQSPLSPLRAAGRGGGSGDQA